MGCPEVPQKMVPKDALVRHSKDLIPPWRNYLELLSRYEDIILSLAPMTPLLLDSSSALAHPIVWRPRDAGITLVELFGAIGTRLAPVLEAGLTVRQYGYVNNSQVSTHIARHHFLQMMVLYPPIICLSVVGVLHVSLAMLHLSMR